MSYGRNSYSGAAYGGATQVATDQGGGVITDPSRPDLPGYRWLTQTSSGPYGGSAYAGGGLIARPVAGGLEVEPDPDLGVVRLSAWWVGAQFLRLVRVYPDGARQPVRGGYPLPIPVATRWNLATNPSVENTIADYLAGTNTALSRVVGATLAGAAFLRARAAAAGSVTVSVPVLLPTDQPFGVSFALALSAAPTDALTVTATWQDSEAVALPSSTATIPAGSLGSYVGRWARTPVLTLTPPGAAVQGVLSISVAGMAADATADLDGLLVERGATTTGVYFDGASPYAAWSGTEHASTSALAVPAALVDGEAPLDHPVSYELTAASDPAYLIRSEPLVLAAPGRGPRSWLSHPDQPGVPVRCKVTAAPELTRATRRGLFAVLGRAEPIAVATSRRASPTGSLTVLTETFTERDRLVDMLADNQPLLLRAPADLGYGPGWWISVGDTVERPQTHYAGPNEIGEALRLHDCPFVVVSAPAVAVA